MESPFQPQITLLKLISALQEPSGISLKEESSSLNVQEHSNLGLKEHSVEVNFEVSLFYHLSKYG